MIQRRAIGYDQLRVGDWVLWMTPNSQRSAEVLRKIGDSLEIQQEGLPRPTVIPFASQYWGEFTVPEFCLHAIVPPPKSAQIGRVDLSHSITPRAAAAFLGITLKQLRVHLRDGRIRGRQEGGTWVEVELPRDGLKLNGQQSQPSMP